MELLWLAGDARSTERAMSRATETSHPRTSPVARIASCRPLAVRAFVALTLCFSMAMLEQAGAAEPAANVDGNRIAAPDPANWPSYGRTYSEQRFSPLSRINADSAPRLGLAWYADLDSVRGQEGRRRWRSTACSTSR
jgi:glucose dehydrogenase